MITTPIALFVYNRPLHTRRTVEALKSNELSKASDLYIFSDAPRTVEQTEAVLEVRQYCALIDGFKSVTIIERETNLGLARSIIEGVTELCEKFGRVIVLEDDLVTSPFFLQYMNDALTLYEHENRVMHISGSMYPIDPLEEETFFLRVPLCWGWGTWNRAWRHFKKDNDVMLRFNRKMRRDFSFNNSYHYWDQLEANRKGLMSTWFVYWYATLFLRNGLALFPGRSLVKNIGMDGSGVNCGFDQNYDVEPSSSGIKVSSIPLRESEEAARHHESFFRKVMPNKPSNMNPHFRIVSIINKIWLMLTHAK